MTARVCRVEGKQTACQESQIKESRHEEGDISLMPALQAELLYTYKSDGSIGETRWMP